MLEKKKQSHGPNWLSAIVAWADTLLLFVDIIRPLKLQESMYRGPFCVPALKVRKTCRGNMSLIAPKTSNEMFFNCSIIQLNWDLGWQKKRQENLN